ncbi:MAG: glycosyltransferase family 2 protein [Acidobacteria bacterium]|nr:MAG: glycosyltransferase family 2 protein [Acidobacteriota bacterium]
MCRPRRGRSSRCCSTRRCDRGFSRPRRTSSRSTVGRAPPAKHWRCSKQFDLCALCILCVLDEGSLTVSVIIVSFNARADLERCLESLDAAPPAAPHEILVVDNGSTDGSLDLARRRPDVRLIEIGSNLGFARASNVGIRASRGANLLLLNSDTVVPDGAIDRLLAALDQDRDVAVVGPRLVDAGGRAELSFGRMIGPLNELRQKRLARGRGVEARTSRRQYPDWVSGACLLVRRADAEAVGLLDERYFMYTEDVDFCAAIRARGRRVLFTPDVEVVHLRGRSAASAPAATRDAYRRSRLAFYEKHHPGWAPLLKLYVRLRRGR